MLGLALSVPLLASNLEAGASATWGMDDTVSVSTIREDPSPAALLLPCLFDSTLDCRVTIGAGAELWDRTLIVPLSPAPSVG